MLGIARSLANGVCKRTGRNSRALVHIHPGILIPGKALVVVDEDCTKNSKVFSEGVLMLDGDRKSVV